jgi:hypothetical protein
VEISSFFVREDPTNSTSKIIQRCLVFKSPLTPEYIREIATENIPMHANNLWMKGVEGKMTVFVFNLEDAQTSAFPVFLYQIMNWEGNPNRQNR